MCVRFLWLLPVLGPQGSHAHGGGGTLCAGSPLVISGEGGGHGAVRGSERHHNKTKQDVSVKTKCLQNQLLIFMFSLLMFSFPSFVTVFVCSFRVFIVQVCYHIPTSIPVLSLPLSYMISGQSSPAVPQGCFSLTFGESIMTWLGVRAGSWVPANLHISHSVCALESFPSLHCSLFMFSSVKALPFLNLWLYLQRW